MSDSLSTTELGLAEHRFTIEGTRPLLMHRGGLANPLDPHAKAISEIAKKRGKTEADYAELARREWRGSLYYDPELGPYLPAELLEAAFVKGGAKHKLGTHFRQGAQLLEDRIPLEYDGPRDVDELEAAVERFYLDAIVRVGQAKTTRRRPMFADWRASFTLVSDTTVLDRQQLELIVATAGRLIGLGDWRPRYGRFTAKLEG